MSAPSFGPLQGFHGGLKWSARAMGESATSIIDASCPPQLVLPLDAPYARARCVVHVGQHVRRGERIGAGIDAADVHAPATGTVVAIEARPLPQASGAPGLCVVIAAHGSDERFLFPPLDAERAPRDALLARLHEAGVVGLGGAGFPTARKLARAVDALIVNGAECEPYIGCDDALLRDHADAVVRGARVLRRACAAARAIVAVEDRMGEAYAALAAALGSSGGIGIDLVRVPTVYPAGGERQLIRVLTGREVPSGGLPQDLGVVCQNVGTAYAAWRAVARGEPLTSRLVGVAGPGVRAPGTFRVRLGTPIADLIAQAGGYTAQAARLVLGGPMMGLALPHDDFPVLKTTNCVLVLAGHEVRARAPELPCIRCGDCMDVCPAQLLPQTLLAQLRAGDYAAAQRQGLSDCIECGACAYVCPSQIPLVDWYRHGKSELRARGAERARIDLARERHVARQARLAHDAAERVARVAARAQTAPAGDGEADASPATAMATATPEAMAPAAASPVSAAPMDKSAVLAAIARAKAKKANAATDAPAAPPEREE